MDKRDSVAESTNARRSSEPVRAQRPYPAGSRAQSVAENTNAAGKMTKTVGESTNLRRSGRGVLALQQAHGVAFVLSPTVRLSQEASDA